MDYRPLPPPLELLAPDDPLDEEPPLDMVPLEELPELPLDMVPDERAGVAGRACVLLPAGLAAGRAAGRAC